MRLSTPALAGIALVLAAVATTSCARTNTSGPRTITVAQSGTADVVGADSAALRKAAAMLRAGDTLSIGPGTYLMEDSLLIPSGVTVKGAAGQTILKKGRGVESLLAEDGDYGEHLLAVEEPGKFHAGMGITVFDDVQKSGWDVSVASVVGVEGQFLRIDPITVRDYDRGSHNARVRNTFPILCAMDAGNVVFEDVIVDGNRAENEYLDGCRGGAIYFYNVRNATVRNCEARNYNGDGISFQISENVQVLNCESHGHAGFGVHPGTGSANPLVENCRLHDNGDVGLFLCWRVRHGKFADNRIENNGRFGISIGHKDTDNEFSGNTIARNGQTGVYFRDESFANSGHRNTFRSNTVVDNGGAKEGYGFYVAPQVTGTVLEGNKIAETRATGGTQRYGVYTLAAAGAVRMQNNMMSGHTGADFKQAAAPAKPAK